MLLVSLDSNRGGTEGDNNSSGGTGANVVVPAVIAAVLFVVLVAVIVGAILVCMKLKRNHQKDMAVLGNPDVSYRNLSSKSDMEDSEK